MKTCRKCKETKPLTEFYKNKDSKDGHLNACKKCQSEQMKESHSENRDERIKKMKDYNSKPENKERARCLQLQRRFGITLDDYNQMFTEQNGCCAVCGKHEKEQAKALAVDHDHETGEVRELLCHACNVSFGLLREDPEIILSLLAYARKYK